MYAWNDEQRIRQDDFFIEILVSVNTVIHNLDPTTLEHEDSRKGKLFYYNGNKLCIATYNCVIFSVECIARFYSSVILKIVCM